METNYQQKYIKYKNKYLKLKTQEKQNKFNMIGGSNTNKTIYLFKAEWCPHCRNFKPTWDKLKDELGNKITFITYDSDKNAKEIKDYNIDGYPTIILKIGDKAIEYVGPRDEESLKVFINKYN